MWNKETLSLPANIKATSAAHLPNPANGYNRPYQDQDHCRSKDANLS